jgi:HSP20 family molecular chaperone IbpA
LKIEQENKFYENRLKKLNEHLRKRIDGRQKEIEKTEEIYDLKTQNVKNEANQKEVEAKEKVSKEIAMAMENKQNKLHEMKEQLNKDRELIDAERELLTDRNNFQMTSMQTDFDQTYKERFAEAYNQAQQINDQSQNTIVKMEADTTEGIQEANRDARKKMDNVITTNEDLLARERDAYLRTLNKTQAENAEMLAKEKLRFEDEMRKLYSTQADSANQKQNIHAQQLRKKEEFYSRLIKQKELGFKSKVQKMHEQHETLISKIQERFKVELDKLLQAHSKRKQNVMEKSADDFYTVKTIAPRVMDGLDHYIVTMELPPHEKDSININVNDRRLRLTLSRNFAETHSEGGVENRAKRNEVLTKTVTLEDIMDPGKVTSSYKDGTLYIKVAKA